MKITRRISFILLMFFYSAFILQLPDFLDKKDWDHATATITYIMCPDGIVYGDFTGYMGKPYTNVALYVDYSFNGHDKWSRMIGEEVDIIYSTDYKHAFKRDEKGIMHDCGYELPKTAHYPNCFMGFITASIALGVSLALFITSSILLKKKDKREQPDKQAGQSNDPTE